MLKMSCTLRNQVNSALFLPDPGHRREKKKTVAQVFFLHTESEDEVDEDFDIPEPVEAETEETVVKEQVVCELERERERSTSSCVPLSCAVVHWSHIIISSTLEKTSICQQVPRSRKKER